MSNARDNNENLDPKQRQASPGTDSVVTPAEDVAWMHYASGNHTAAIEYFHEALQSPELQPYPDKFRLLLGITDCHRRKGEYAEAEQFIMAARATLPDAPPSDAIGKLEYREAFIQRVRGGYDDALKRAFAAYRRLKNSSEHREVAGIQTLIGECYLRLGMVPEAEEFFSDSLSSYRRVDDKVGMGYAYNNLGVLHKNACRWQRALASFDRAMEIAKSLGLSQHLVMVQLNLGVVYSKTRRFADAESVLTAAISSAERLGDQMRVAKGLLTLGRTHVLAGDFARAEKTLMRAKAIAADQDYARESALADEFIGELMFARGRLVEARVNFRRALDSARSFAPEGDIVAECLSRLAATEYRLGRAAAALEAAEEGIRIATTSEPFELGALHRTRGLCLAREGDFDRAADALALSVEKFTEHESYFEKATSLQVLARVYARRMAEGDPVRARQALAASVAEFAAVEDGAGQIVSQLMSASLEHRMGNNDEALLAVCDADRIVEEEHLDRFRAAVRALRQRIERGMTSASTRVVDEFSVLGEIQSGARSREHLAKGVGSTLELILERLDADAGFVAIPSESGRSLQVIARDGLTAREAQAAAAWYSKRPASDDPKWSEMITDFGTRAEFKDLSARLDRRSGTVLLQGLGFDEERLGFLFVHHNDDARRSPMGQDALDFVAAYASLISLSIYELLRNERRDRRRSQLSERSKGFEHIVTENTEMLKLLGLAERVAQSNATVMLQGETGTGKGLIAYAIHLLSDRRERKFVHVNCAALPEQLLESELFGHMRGAFTGAHADKVGLLEQANGGTVFLDEIGKTSMAMQGKLLQFLDNSMVRRVGSNDYVHVDVRVICASKANLLSMVHEGRFLEDFFYRINDFPLHVPPLRERPEDVPLLMHHYIDKISREMDKTIPGATDEFVERLRGYAWPGNVRELEKIVKRAVILAEEEETLDLSHLAPEVMGDAGPALSRVAEEMMTLRQRIEKLEEAEIARALRRSEGNKSRAAVELGISYPNLLSKIKRYNIQ